MGIPKKPLLAFLPLLFIALHASCFPTGGHPDDGKVVYITYTTTLDPTTARLRPAQSVTFAFAAVENGINQPLPLTNGDMQWTLEGTPSYPVGTLVPITDTPISEKKTYCRFDAAPNLPQGVTQISFTLRAKVKAVVNGNVLQATSSITVDLNALAPAILDEQPSGGQP